MNVLGLFIVLFLSPVFSESNSSIVIYNEFLGEEEKKHKSWISENWPFLVYGIISAVIGIFCVIAIRSWGKKHKKEIKDLHENLKDYVSDVKFSRLTNCQRFGFIICAILCLPIWLPVIIFSILLAALIPIGLIFGIIEHKFVVVWAIMAFFIQIGGILDLFADIALLCNLLVQFFLAGLKIDIVDSESEDGPEAKLDIARALITLSSGLFLIIVFKLVSGSVGDMVDKVTGKRVFGTGGKASSSTSMTGQALVMAIIIVAVFWKVLLISLRLYLLYIILKSLFRVGELSQIVQRKIQWVELLLYLDLMVSGIPLGIVTALELFVFEEGGYFVLGEENLLECIKILALAVDLVSASFFCWYIVFGLNNKIPLLSHHHHHHHDKDHKHINSIESVGLLSHSSITVYEPTKH